LQKNVNHNFLEPQNFSNPAKFIATAFIALLFAILFGGQKICNLIVFLCLLFTLSHLLIRGFLIFLTCSQKQIHVSIVPTKLVSFTILLPLYKENLIVIQKLVESISNLKYPTNLLDCQIVVEQHDNETINNVKACNLPHYFSVVLVPHGPIKTKPQACNYAMQFAKGEIVAIYDAEDAPDANQLLAVCACFNNNYAVDIVQCPLLFYNSKQNFLTKNFQMEYFAWFKLTLPAICKYNLPLCLGGTSNFIRIEFFHKHGLWCGKNLTEDAELGLRAFAHGVKTAFVNYPTLEECPFELKNWLNQRKRWIKGFNQTYFFYFATFLRRKYKLLPKLVFFFLHGSSAIGFLAVLLLLTGEAKFALSTKATMWQISNAISWLTLGLSLGISTFAWKRLLNTNWFVCLAKSLGSAAYFCLHPIAAIFAIFDLIKKPFHWDKTNHHGNV